MLKNSSLSSVEEKSFDENSSQELSLQSLSEISGGSHRKQEAKRKAREDRGRFLEGLEDRHSIVSQTLRHKRRP